MSVTTAPRAQVEKYGEGKCVAVIEKNGYHDSYFTGVFAVPAVCTCSPAESLTDHDPGCPVPGGWMFTREETGATAYAGGYVPVEDATEDVLAAYRAQRDAAMDRLTAEREAREARMVEAGKPVTVVDPVTRGKNKTAAGDTGVVKRRVVNDFDSSWAKQYGHRTYRVQVEMADDGRVLWMDEDRVRVTGFEDERLPVRDSQVDYVIAAQWPDR